MISTLRELSMRGPVKAPRHAMVSSAEIPAWRWGALLAIFIAIAHDRVHRQAGEVGLAELLAGTRLAPSAGVLEAWSLILFAVLAYAVFQLGEEQRRLSVYDRASRPLVLVCALVSARLAVLQQGGGLVAATAFAAATALAAGVAYHRVYAEIAEGRARGWIGVPFSLLLAYTAGTAAAGLDAVIVDAGQPSTATAVTLIAAAGLGAIYLGLTRRDVFLPGFVAWMLTSICAARPPAVIATSALIAGALAAIAAIVIAAAQLEARGRARSATRSGRRAPALR
jgi:hypothetical protein